MRSNNFQVFPEFQLFPLSLNNLQLIEGIIIIIIIYGVLVSIFEL